MLENFRKQYLQFCVAKMISLNSALRNLVVQKILFIANAL